MTINDSLPQLRMIMALIRADFLERVRSYRFLAMLLFSVFLTYFFLPAPGAILYVNLAMGPARPAYTSAAVGSIITLLMGEFFTLFSFYLVIGSIERDWQTGVGQIIATTPISRPVYMVGKWLSNTAVIAAMVAVIILSAVILQLVRGEDPRVDVWGLAAPLLVILLPALILVAALAVLFESVPWLRGGLGNVAYFVVFILLLSLPVDFEGINILYPSLYQACAAQFSGCIPVRQIDLSGAMAGMPVFNYTGMSWTWRIITGRLLFVVAGLLIAVLAALPFHRFDPAHAGGSLFSRLFQRVKDAALRFVTTEEEPDAASQSTVDIRIAEPFAPSQKLVSFLEGVSTHALPSKSGNLTIFRHALAAEFLLAFNGVRWWWFAGAAAVELAGLAVQSEYVMLVVLPLAWIWPLLIWSGMGARETRHGVEQLVYAAPHPITRQLAAAWLVGVLVALGMAVGVILRQAILGQWQVVLAVLAGALFVATLALAAGCWTGGSKLFEAGYLFLWYMASVHSVPVLDFMGRIPQMRDWGLPWVYLGLTVTLAILAVMGRLRSINR